MAKTRYPQVTEVFEILGPAEEGIVFENDYEEATYSHWLAIERETGNFRLLFRPHPVTYWMTNWRDPHYTTCQFFRGDF